MSHERALYGRLSASDCDEIEIQTCPMPAGYRLLRVPISLPGCSGFGVAVVHSDSESVPFWAQVAVLPAVGGSSRLAAHVVSRKSWAHEHREALHRILKGLLYDYLAPEFDLVLSRVSMDWHIWLSMLSMLTCRGLAIYVLMEPNQRLELLDAEDMKEQNEDILDVLMHLDQGTAIASWSTDLTGRSARLDEQLIERLDSEWLDLNR